MSGLNEISPLLPHYRFVILIIILGEKLEIPGGKGNVSQFIQRWM